MVPKGPLRYGVDVDVVESFREVLRHGRPPGANNLVEPIADYLQERGSAKREEISAYLEDAWRRAGGTTLSGSEWGSPAERDKWTPRVKKAGAKLRAAGRVREATTSGGERSMAFGNPSLPMSLPLVSDRRRVWGVARTRLRMYFKRDKEDALAKGENRWRMKVGKTAGRSPHHRIQDGAFLPDKLEWGAGSWTDNPGGDERVVQQALESRGLRYEGTGGRGWFVTNPQEIVEVYRAIRGE